MPRDKCHATGHFFKYFPAASCRCAFKASKWLHKSSSACFFLHFTSMSFFNCNTMIFINLVIARHIFGASLSDPHTSMTVLQNCLRSYTVNFKWGHLNISRRLTGKSRASLLSMKGYSVYSQSAASAWKEPGVKTTQVNACMATADHDRQGQAAHRQYKLHTIVEFAMHKRQIIQLITLVWSLAQAYV